MASLRERQKELTRQSLLDAGYALFVEKGYAQVTIDEIATAAGTTRVTFYAYFPSKRDLVKALLDERLNELLQRVFDPEHGSRAESLVTVARLGTREVIADWLSHMAERWPRIRPLIRMGQEASAVEPASGDLVAVWLEGAISDIEEGLDAAGRLDPHVRHFVGVLAMAELDYVNMHWETSDWKIDRDRMLAALTESWFRLFGATA